ncbi:MAG: protein kinase, partial [Longimicrobiales bacterium]|nr:protein kinase [Longimicrobiales bacterium]
MIGQTVSRYRIDEKIGEGGMGVVYRAEDIRLKRPVALKFLPPHLVADLRAKDRFLQEARAASALDHPNICVIYEIDETETGELFIAMAHYDGETLAEKLQRGPLPIPDVIEIARQVALGLSKAHERGIVHRDIKPANLMVTEDGIWKILDFGIAKLSGASRLTRTGRAVGTVAYMSPEQAERDEASAQSDIWSLGVVFYEMLAGCLPFHGATPVATLFQILYEEPDSLAEARDEVPPELDRIVSRALAKDLGVRYGSMAELLEDLEPLSGAATKPPIPTGAALQPERAPKELTATPPPFLTPSGEPSHEAALLRFAGRESELEVLEGWFQEALAGRGRVGFITGEAGTGKTALVREFCRRAAESHDDLIAATGECDAHTGPGDPHHPFREILGLLTGDVEAQWAAGSLSADHATRLWSFLPSTVRALVESGPDLVGTLIPDAGLLSRADTHPTLEQSWRGRLQGIVERRRSGIQQTDLIDQLVRVLWTLARERPFLLVVDDLQWADAGTMGTLFQLGKRLAGSRVLLVGLFRPSEVALGRDGQRHPLESVVHELSGRFGEVVLEVGATGHRPFVDALVDAEPNRLGSSFRKALFSQTQGHALFTVELLRSLREQGMLVQNPQGEWQEGAAPIDWSRLPARVDAIIGERLDRLPANLRRLLTIAAVEGAEFTLEAAAMVQDVGIRELIGPVSMELEKRHRLISTHGLRRLNGQKLSVYRFRHILFQRHLYDELSEVERVHLHEQLGEALETLYGDHKDEIAPQLARHFKEAGLSQYVDARLGDAHEIVPALEGPFDFVFSDADKEWYKNYFVDVYPKLKIGGCFTAHN